MEEKQAIHGLPYSDFDDATRKKWEEERKPYSALVELTPRCNMNCVHCYLQKKHLEKELEWERIREILDIIYEKGVLFLTFTGGEIFTRKDFCDIYGYAKEKGFMVELFTNGLYVPDEVLDLLEKYPPVLVDVSIYGASEDTYYKVTGIHGAYEKVVKNCKRMIARNIRVSLRSPILQDTYGEIGEMKKNADDMGITFRTSFEISPTVEGDFVTQNYQVSVKEALRYEMEEFFGRGQRNLDQEPQDGAENKELLFSCKMGRGAFVVDYEGNIFPCMKFRHIGVKLDAANFDDIWQSYSQYHGMRYREGHKCLDCAARYYCEICPAEMDFLYGDLQYRSNEACKIAHFRKQLYGKEVDREQAIMILEKEF